MNNRFSFNNATNNNYSVQASYESEYPDSHDQAGSMIDSGTSKTSNQSSSVLTNTGTMSKVRDQFFVFLVNLNTKTSKISNRKEALLNALLYVYVFYVSVIVSSYSSLFLYNDDGSSNTTSSQRNWGLVGGWIWRALFYPVNFALEHYPYEVIVAFSCVFVAVELGFLSLCYAFRLLSDRGHAALPQIRRVLRWVATLFVVFSPFIAWVHCVPLSVNHSTQQVLVYFPHVSVLSSMNIAFMVIGIVGCILSMIVVVIGAFISVETIPPPMKYVLFAMEREHPLVVLILTNMASVIVTTICGTQYLIVSSCIKIVLGLVTCFLFVKALPFYKRWENSFVIGIMSCKVIGPLGPFVSSFFTGNNDVESIGGAITGATLAAFFFAFLIGFIASEIYLRVILSWARKPLLEYFNNKGASKSAAVQIYNQFDNMKEMKRLNTFIKFSLSSFETREDSDFSIANAFITKCGSNKALLDVDFLILSALYFGFFGAEDDHLMNTVTAISNLSRAVKQAPSIIQKYHIVLRMKEIETNASNAKTFNIELKQQLTNVDKKQQVVMYFHREFFKELLLEKPSLTKLDNINRTICKLLNDCDNIFRNMFLTHKNNKTLLRAYASFLETCRWETETAKQLYEEANMLEEEDARREKKKTSTNPQKPIAKNKIVPAVRSSLELFDEKEQQPAAEGYPAQDFMDEKPTDEDKWESVSVAGNEDEKKEQFYRAAINTKEDLNSFRVWFAIFCVLSTLVIATCLVTSLLLLENFSKQISLQEKVCSLSGIPHLLNIEIRAVQARLNMASHEIDKIELAQIRIIAKHQMEFLFKKIHDVQEASTSGEFIDQVVKTYTNVEWKYFVPVAQADESLMPIYDVSNASIGDFVDLLVDSGEDIMAMLNDWHEFNKTIANYHFLLIYLNKDVAANAFDSFCVSFLEGTKTTTQQSSIIFHSIYGIVLGLYVIFVMIYIAVMRTQLLQINRLISAVFGRIPNDETGKVYHSFAKKIEDTHLHKVRIAVFTPQVLFSSMTVAVVAIVVIVWILLIVEYNSNAKKAQTTMMATNSLNTVVKSIMLANFNLVEIAKRSRLVSSTFSELKRVNQEQLITATSTWRSLTVGMESQNYKSAVYHVFPEIDQLLSGGCSNVSSNVTSKLESPIPYNASEVESEELQAVLSQYSNAACLGMEDLIDIISSHLTELTQEFFSGQLSSEVSIEIYFSHIYYYSVAFSRKIFEFISTFVNLSKSPSVIITYVCAFTGTALLLVLFYFSYNSLQTFWNEKHAMRTLLNYIHWSVIETHDHLKEYVLSHEISGYTYQFMNKMYSKLKNTERAGKNAEANNNLDDPFSMTRSILSAAVDGVALCSQTGKDLTWSIQEFNKSAEEMFMHKRNEIFGLDISITFSTESHSQIKKILNGMMSSHSYCSEILETNCLRKNKTTFPAKVTICLTYFQKKPIVTFFFRDITMEKKQNSLIQEEKQKSEQLLLNILPKPVAIRLMEGERNIYEKIPDLSVFFSDMVGFTKMSSKMEASELVLMLNEIVESMDLLTDKHGLDKIKTIGDAYFCVGGAYASKVSDHPERMLKFCIDIFTFLHKYNKEKKKKVNVRIGIHTGAAVGGVIGTKKFAFDLWGDTINTASRMESTGVEGRVQISRSCYERVYDLGYQFEEREPIEVKGKGKMQTYLLAAKHHPSPIPGSESGLNDDSKSQTFDETSSSVTLEITKPLSRTLGSISADNLSESERDSAANRSNKSVKTNSQPNMLKK
ncbi:hypothetical protein C9374_012071 [Naegleria lovaniensis]|uniref:Guanylate cyclase domain-containing protein n=1 Tax=Naegleria lovaniensis TaxID=51637 RepID=A0AA88GDD4_NAELO|nr:uncharacterized protein C9374_012071 [Naegleria lovaniensis]KAG2373464.1 hypothetical protein C9374_012071 [Naegleria lovaniensis]